MPVNLYEVDGVTPLRSGRPIKTDKGSPAALVVRVKNETGGTINTIAYATSDGLTTPTTPPVSLANNVNSTITLAFAADQTTRETRTLTVTTSGGDVVGSFAVSIRGKVPAPKRKKRAAKRR